MEGILRFKMGWAKQPKTANTNSPWAYNDSGELIIGRIFASKFGVLILGRAFFFGGGGTIGMLRYAQG